MRYIKLFCVPLFVPALAFPLMLPCLIIAAVLRENAMLTAFAVPLAAALLTGVPLFFSFRKNPPKLHPHDGFFAVTFSWFLLALWGALPYYLSGGNFSLTNAVFESACGFATTGASTIVDVEALPHSLLFWRSISHWIGGMGIILLTVALLPLLGVGGFQLVKAETPGPEKEKITPKITAAAKVLWLFYCALTLLVFALYLLGGMSVFDALCHAFTTLATGGISTKNNGLAFYNSAYLERICAVFMLLAAVNFNLYYKLLQRNFKDVFYNSELRGYMVILIAAAALITMNILPLYDSGGAALHSAFCQTASFLSTAGTAFTDYTRWPPLAQTTLFILMFAGGCSGSTAGGIKIIRHIVLYKQAGNEMRRLIYPRGVFSVQLNHKVGRKDVVYGVAGFMFLYMLIIALTTLIAASAGFDMLTSISAALSVLGNIGSGFGAIGPGNNYAIFPDYIKWFYSFVMIAGRLELWTVLLLFHREYWHS